MAKAGLIYLFAKTNATDRVSCFLLDPKSPGVARTKLKTMGQPAGTVARTFHESCIFAYLEGKLDLARSAMLKLHAAQTACRVVDECVQLHGGAGWMDSSTVSRIYTSIRLQRIYAGTDEMQKIAIARSF